MGNRQPRVVLDVLQDYPVTVEVLQSSILGPMFFLGHINDRPHNFICNTAISADDTTFYSKIRQASDLWQYLALASELDMTYKTLWTMV